MSRYWYFIVPPGSITASNVTCHGAQTCGILLATLYRTGAKQVLMDLQQFGKSIKNVTHFALRPCTELAPVHDVQPLDHKGGSARNAHDAVKYGATDGVGDSWVQVSPVDLSGRARRLSYAEIYSSEKWHSVWIREKTDREQPIDAQPVLPVSAGATPGAR